MFLRVTICTCVFTPLICLSEHPLLCSHVVNIQLANYMSLLKHLFPFLSLTIQSGQYFNTLRAIITALLLIEFVPLFLHIASMSRSYSQLALARAAAVKLSGWRRLLHYINLSQFIISYGRKFFPPTVSISLLVFLY